MHSIIESTKSSLSINTINTSSPDIKWSWACRILKYGSRYSIEKYVPSIHQPIAGDLALVKVISVGHHNSIVNINNRKSRIYEGDLVVGVFGNRYATDAIEAEVLGFDDLSILTAGGMIGTVKSTHREFGKATSVTFIGFLKDDKGKCVNLKEVAFKTASLPYSSESPLPLSVSPSSSSSNSKNLFKDVVIVAVVGTGMNSGKTTAARMLIKSLSDRGLRVAACKLTGSVSNRDQDELRSAYANSTIDFSDYGFPSTYLCNKEELFSLFNTMIADLEKTESNIIIMEIADGILQRETAFLLSSQLIKGRINGIILAADSAPSALYATEKLKSMGHNVIAVSGSITSSPLFVREFRDNEDKIPVVASVTTGEELADAVLKVIHQRQGNQ